MKTIYLCGGINKLSDSEATDWREAAKARLSSNYTFLDPMRRDYRGRELECVDEIVDGDMADIIKSDILLVNAVRPSWGTGMEVFYAAALRENGFLSTVAHGPRMIVTVCPLDQPSPWLIRHSTYVVKTFESAFKILKRYA